MEKNLEKTYNPQDIEQRLYEKWLNKKYFHAKVDKKKKPFSIVMPPPNITGKLHMGHALDNTMQDILIRFKRMQGFEALWMPGTDHASISTEVKVINQLKSEGIDKEELGREGFLKRTWEWKEEYGGTIVSQLKKMGTSGDWDRERFTLDEGCSKAVEEVFIRLYEKGYIYKGSRIINWCPVCKTSISDAEVEHEEKAGHFWHINYPIVGTDEFLQIATTRPETLLGDSAVAVHPEDERYAKYIGKSVMLPLVNKEIPIIADSYVDKEFGTGVVKITPAHDPNDFEVGKRHNLPEINVMNDDATINELGGKYAGMDRYVARKEMVKDLDDLGLLVKVEDHTHNVGTHDRCKAVVEPLIKQQWFVKMEDMAKSAVDALKSGDLEFIPDRFDKVYMNWLDNIRDWCISRQLWWGHRIPAYYCDKCGEFIVSRDIPEKCSCGHDHFTQDPDTLDTWFSSALWPFSTLGWPEKTPELEYFYPTNVLVTGYDIIFFWVIRMVFSGIEYTGKTPFSKVIMHGLVRDSEGRKMSKSLGNGIDPLEIIDQYGADALRLTLITGNAPGNDMRFYMERVEASRNFANKVWNASRFIMMNFEKAEISDTIDLATLTQADKWILSKVNELTKDVTENLEKYDMGVAVQKIYDFIWEEFCDWYIEMVKPRLYNDEDATKAAALWTLRTVLIDSLKLLHPYMPFITEEIFCSLQDKEESIMISEWPVYKEEYNFKADEEAVEVIKAAVKGIRNVRAEMNVPPSKKATVIVVSEDDKVRTIFETSRVFFATLGYASEIIVQNDKSNVPEDAVSTVIPDAVIYMPFAELVDIEKEIERLEKEKARLDGELRRVTGMLSNEKFVSKAPEAKINEEKAKLENYTNMMNQVTERLNHLKK
jgi:valyl-tRNA synthetase